MLCDKVQLVQKTEVEISNMLQISSRQNIYDIKNCLNLSIS